MLALLLLPVRVDGPRRCLVLNAEHDAAWDHQPLDLTKDRHRLLQHAVAPQFFVEAAEQNAREPRRLIAML